MDKKVYNKPSLKLEIFTPNEYIASCWYIAEGDCYSDIIYKDNDEYFQANKLPPSINANHGSHRVPASGYFRTDGSAPIPEPDEVTLSNTEYWWTGGTLPGNNGQTQWSKERFTRIFSYYYYKDGNGKEHYFKKISHPSNQNATS